MAGIVLDSVVDVCELVADVVGDDVRLEVSVLDGDDVAVVTCIDEIVEVTVMDGELVIVVVIVEVPDDVWLVVGQESSK